MTHPAPAASGFGSSSVEPPSPTNPKAIPDVVDLDLSALWRELANDPNTPDRFEMTEHGEIVLDPWPGNEHQRVVSRVAGKLSAQLGKLAINRVALLTATAGVRVPDVVWIPEGQLEKAFAEDPMRFVPPLVVEVLAAVDRWPAIAHKVRAYLETGVTEVVMVREDGTVEFHRRDGVYTESALGVVLSRKNRSIAPKGADTRRIGTTRQPWLPGLVTAQLWALSRGKVLPSSSSSDPNPS